MFDDMISLACGVLGFSFEIALDFTLRELSLMKETREKVELNRDRGEWERARWMAALIMQPHVRKPISLQKLARFPWELDESAEKLKWLKEAMKNDKRFPDKI